MEDARYCIPVIHRCIYENFRARAKFSRLEVNPRKTRRLENLALHSNMQVKGIIRKLKKSSFPSAAKIMSA